MNDRGDKSQKQEDSIANPMEFWLWVKRFSLAIGILLTTLNIVWFLAKYDQYSRAVEGSKPAFDVDYYEMISGIELLDGKYGNGVLQNKVLRYWQDAAHDEITLFYGEEAEYSDIKIMLLGIRVAGGAAAEQVQLHMREYTSDPYDAITVIDPTDFYDFIDERSYSELTHAIGDLFKDDGVLIPLLVFGQSDSTPYSPVFRHAIIPVKISYIDSITGENYSIDVRRFFELPLIISATVASRG